MKKTITTIAFILSAIFLQGQTTIKQSAITVQTAPADTDRIVGWRSTTGNPPYNYTLPNLATYFSGKISGITWAQTTGIQAALNSGSTVTIGTTNVSSVTGFTSSMIGDSTTDGRALLTASLATQKTILGITGGSGGSTSWGGITGTLSTQTDLQTALNAKQDTLVSGTNIKTINGVSVLGAGDLAIASGGGSSIPGMISLWPTANIGSLPSGWQASDGTNGTTSVSGTTGTTAVTLLNATSATPTFSPVAGTYGSTQSVTISADAGYTIRYNTTGAPTRASTLYSSPVSVPASSTLYAVAYKDPSLLSAVGSAAYVIGATYIVNDTFTSASSQLLSAHTPDTGGVWTVAGSTGMTVGAGTGLATMNTTSTDTKFTNATLPSTANYTMGFVGQIVSSVGANSGFTLWGRHADDNNAYLLNLDYTGAVLLRTRVAGALTQLGSIYNIPGFSLTTDYTVELVMSGTSISAKVNGATVIGPITNADQTVIGTPQFSVIDGSTSPTLTQVYIK